MTRKLRISSTLSLPIEAVTETFAILAKRGAGKTYTAAVLVEELSRAGAQTVIIDPIGVWWGLRASADGKGPGIPILIFGGDHGDVPLDPASGAVVADLVVNEGLSVVLDVSLFRKGEQKRFVKDFAERLYHKNRAPLHLVLDEADEFAPQRPFKGDERMLGAVEDLVRRGRARGIGVSLITQRSAVLNKNVLSQAEVLITLRTTSPQDRAAIDEWIKHHGDQKKRMKLMQDIASLPVGTAYVWSPGWLDIFQKVKIRKRLTFDSSITPKVGEKAKKPKRLAPVDLKRISKQIESTIEKAKQEDPKLLRRRIFELEKEAKKKGPVTKTLTKVETKTKTVEVPVIGKKMMTRFEKAFEKVQRIQESLNGAVNELREARTVIEKALIVWDPKNRPAPKPVPRAVPPQPVRIVSPPRRETRAAPVTLDGEEVTLLAGERKILETVAVRHPTKMTRSQVGTLSGYTSSGGTFKNYFGKLKRVGFLREKSHEITITDEGFAFLGDAPPSVPQTTQETLAMWEKALLAGEWKMLRYLVDIYPQSVTLEQWGEDTGFTSSGGTFKNYKGSLRRNGLAELDGATARASDDLFMEASRA